MDMSKCPICGADTYIDRRGGSDLRGCTCGWRMVERHPVDGGKGLGAESVPALMEEIGRLRERCGRLETALNDLFPGLALDLRMATEDDDIDALRSRVKTITDALADAPPAEKTSMVEA